MIIVVSVSTNKIGSKCTDEFEIEDDAAEDDIEEAARECMFNMIEWNYKKQP